MQNIRQSRSKILSGQLCGKGLIRTRPLKFCHCNWYALFAWFILQVWRKNGGYYLATAKCSVESSFVCDSISFFINKIRNLTFFDHSLLYFRSYFRQYFCKLPMSRVIPSHLSWSTCRGAPRSGGGTCGPSVAPLPLPLPAAPVAGTGLFLPAVVVSLLLVLILVLVAVVEEAGPLCFWGYCRLVCAVRLSESSCCAFPCNSCAYVSCTIYCNKQI